MGFALLVAYLVLVFVRPGELYPELAAWPLMEIASSLALGAAVLALLTGRGPTFRAPQLPLFFAFLLWAGVGVVAGTPPGESFDALLGFAKGTGVAFLLLVLNVDSVRRVRIVAATLCAMELLVVGEGILAHHRGYRTSPFAAFAGMAGAGETQGWDESPGIPGAGGTSPEAPGAPTSASGTRIGGVGLFSDPNELAGSLVSILPLLLTLRRPGLALRNALVVWAPAAIMLYGIYLTRSRGGLIALAGVVGLALRERLGRLLAVVLAIGLAIALIGLGFLGGREMALDASAVGRVEAWSEGLQMLKAAPLWGVGFGSFTRYNPRVAHNSFVHCLAEVGLVGYFLWLALVVLTLDDVQSVGANEEKVVGEASEEDQEEAEDLELRRWGRALVLSLAGFLVGAFFLSRTYDLMLFLLLGLSVALADVARRRDSLPGRLDPLLWTLRIAALEAGSIVVVWLYLRLLR